MELLRNERSILISPVVKTSPLVNAFPDTVFFLIAILIKNVHFGHLINYITPQNET